LSDEVHFAPGVGVLGRGCLRAALESRLQNMLKYALCSYGPNSKYTKRFWWSVMPFNLAFLKVKAPLLELFKYLLINTFLIYNNNRRFNRGSIVKGKQQT